MQCLLKQLTGSLDLDGWDSRMALVINYNLTCLIKPFRRKGLGVE